jgi:hypothetical protein
MGIGVLKGNTAELRALQALQQDVARDTKIVNRQSREHSVPDVQALRHGVEGECDQGFVGGSGFLRMIEGSFQKLAADTMALMRRRHEQLSEKP